MKDYTEGYDFGASSAAGDGRTDTQAEQLREARERAERLTAALIEARSLIPDQSDDVVNAVIADIIDTALAGRV